MRHWLSQPHAREWWGEVEDELALIYDGKGEHEPYLACVEGELVAYIQAWWPSQHPDLPWQHGMGRDTRGIDIAIGDEKNLNRGLGSHIIKNFARRLLEQGSTRVVIDPDITNHLAIAAYRKAGFRPYAEHLHPEGTDLLMELLSPRLECMNDQFFSP